MKHLIKISCALLMVSCCFFTVQAQSKKNKKAEKVAGITAMINAREYVFKANYANPSRGWGTRALTSDYDLTVSKDTVTAFLPYFGRAYLADYGSIDEGIKLTTTHFDYQVNNKKGNWDILITPEKSNLTDPKAVQSLRLNVSRDGYASLQVMSFNRDPISFDGVIEGKGKYKLQ